MEWYSSRSYGIGNSIGEGGGEMKTIIFIDNDLEEKAKDNLATACRMIKYNGRFNIRRDNVKLIHEFHKVQNQFEDKLFDPSNIIVSWSMFTDNHFGSYSQLCDFMVMAGLMQLEGKIYINTSSYLKETLTRAIEHYNQSVYIIRCIESNLIIHYDEDEEKFFRLRVNIHNDDFLSNEGIDLNQLLS